MNPDNPTNNSLFVIAEQENYSPKLGLLISQLQNARHYLKNAIRNLSQEKLEQDPRASPNTIAQLLAHLCAAETFFQAMTFHDRRFNDEEQEDWGAAFQFKDSPKTKNRDLSDYLTDLDTIRQETLEQFKTKDDTWLETKMTFFGQPANMHYYWFHYLQDEVRHTGQISLIRKHLLKDAEPDFNPYSVG